MEAQSSNNEARKLDGSFGRSAARKKCNLQGWLAMLSLPPLTQEVANGWFRIHAHPGYETQVALGHVPRSVG